MIRFLLAAIAVVCLVMVSSANADDKVEAARKLLEMRKKEEAAKASPTPSAVPAPLPTATPAPAPAGTPPCTVPGKCVPLNPCDQATAQYRADGTPASLKEMLRLCCRNGSCKRGGGRGGSHSANVSEAEKTKRHGMDATVEIQAMPWKALGAKIQKKAPSKGKKGNIGQYIDAHSKKRLDAELPEGETSSVLGECGECTTGRIAQITDDWGHTFFEKVCDPIPGCKTRAVLESERQERIAMAQLAADERARQEAAALAAAKAQQVPPGALPGDDQPAKKHHGGLSGGGWLASGLLGGLGGAALGCGVGGALHPSQGDSHGDFSASGCGYGAAIGVLPGAAVGIGVAAIIHYAKRR